MYCSDYVIQTGDSLYSISRQFGVRMDALMAANPLVNVYNLRAGETLCIPVSVPSNQISNYTTYIVQQGDTLGSVLNNNGINLADFIQRNSLNNIYLMPGTTLQVPVVGEGQTMR